MIRRVALALCLLLLLGDSASADPITLAAYRRGLAEIRAQVAAAPDAPGAARAAAIGRAIVALEALTDVTVDGIIYTAPPHAPVRALLQAGDAASLARALGMLDETIAALDHNASLRAQDPAAARRQLEAILASVDFRPQPDWRDALAAILRDWLAGLFPGLRAPRITFVDVGLLLSPVALALLAYVLWTSARGIRERVAREVALASPQSDRAPSAREHLALAEAAARAGRGREAVRELFLFALRALDERGALRFDPALTDREVLERVAGLAGARELDALVAVYERAWYGLREPSPQDLSRARELAHRVAA